MAWHDHGQRIPCHRLTDGANRSRRSDVVGDVAAPKSEEGACDTDVQTLGAAGRPAHAQLPPTMMRL